MTTPNKIAGETVELRAGHLDDQQLARAEALDRARSVLVKKSGGFTPGTSDVDPLDLIQVATWIISGDEPPVDEPPVACVPFHMSTQEYFALRAKLMGEASSDKVALANGWTAPDILADRITDEEKLA